MLREQGLHSLPFETAAPKPGSMAARAAGYFLHAQLESGSLCPLTMTFASIPVLQQEPALYASLREQLLSRQHDPRDIPLGAGKQSMMIGMGMTEKQGGSDVRSNRTRAVATGAGGRGGEYRLIGHKWFFSAPHATPIWCWRAPVTTRCRRRKTPGFLLLRAAIRAGWSEECRADPADEGQARQPLER